MAIDHQRSNLTHAQLEVFEPNPDGTTGSPGRAITTLSFQFNPSKLNVTKSARWVRKASNNASSAGVPEFTGAQPGVLSVDLLFDASRKPDNSVMDSVQRLLACCRPTADSRRRKQPSPPWVLFRWGPLTESTSYVREVEASYTLFTASGLPVRAVCHVVMEEISSEVKKQNPTSGTLNARRVHRVIAGDSLASLAWREYADPTLWRVIAEANGLDDPLRLRLGDTLLLPTVDEIGPGRGGPGHGR